MKPRALTLLFLSLVGLSACDREQAAMPPPAAESDVLAATESSRDFGDYVLHFNALTTDQLTPEVARQHSIVRSQTRALLNVSILRKREGATPISVSGAVAASAVNLSGQLKNLLVREVREGDAVYFIAETPITDGETLIFTVDATPQNEASRFTVRFRKQFFVD